MTFEEWWATPVKRGDGKVIAKAAWDAATEEVKKDHFKIGEEIQSRADDSKKWNNCVVVLSKHGVGYVHKNVRRIPAWEPKDGEAVLAKSKSGKAFYAVSAGGMDIYDNNCPVSGIIEAYDIKPWKPGCQGRPWVEV